MGHNPVRQATPPTRFLEMARQGYREEVYECRPREDGTGGCGRTWTRVWSRRTGMLVDSTDRYPQDFAVPKGTGRLSRAEARKATWEIEDAPLYKLARSRNGHTVTVSADHVNAPAAGSRSAAKT